MKRSSYEQFAIVHADSASLFNQQLNAEIRRLKDNSPTVHFSESIPFYAQIKYIVNEETPETISEASEMEGVRFVCAQCPYFKAPLKDDGTEDKRCKYGDCEHAELGRTFKKTAACEKLYDLIAEGGIKICFTD
jgi:hypothetical protein